MLDVVKTIPSRPVYENLHALTGSSHLLVADGSGGQAILDFARQLPADWFAAAHTIYGARSEMATRHALQAVRPRQWNLAPSIPSALPRLSKVLEDAHMGLRLYLAGTEGLIG